MDDIWIFSPVEFDPKNYPGTAIEKLPDASRWLLHLIYSRTTMYKLDQDIWINIQKEKLALVMGDSKYITKVRDALEKEGLIEVNHSYCPGQYSKGYRLGEKLIGKRWKKYPSKDKKFIKRVLAHRAGFNKGGFSIKGGEAFMSVYEHLYSWMGKVFFPNDMEPVFNTIEDPDKEGLARHQVDLVRTGQIGYSVCPYERFHSNFSYMVKELRPHLQFKHKGKTQRLMEVDIKNCQPFMLAAMLREFSISSPSISSPSSTPTYRMWRVFEEFTQDACQGVFHDKFTEIGLTREEVKDEVFTFIYGQEWMMEKSKLSVWFQAFYPAVYAFIKDVKRKNGYKWLAQELQRKEAKIMIQGVGSRLEKEYPQVCVITVHDSILTTSDNIPLIKGLILEETQKATGLVPTLKG